MLCLDFRPCQKVPKLDFQCEFSMLKIIQIFQIFFSMKNKKLGAHFLLKLFFGNYTFETTLFTIIIPSFLTRPQSSVKHSRMSIISCDAFGPEPIWSLTSCPPGQMVPNKFGPHGKMVPQNLVPLDKWSPTNSVPVFPDPYSLSPWTNRIF